MRFGFGKALLGAFALLMAAPSAPAAPLTPGGGPVIMEMRYTVDGLSGAVHSRRTITGVRTLVVTGRAELAPSLARQGFVVVVAPVEQQRHAELWRQVEEGRGPLFERFAGFRGHLDIRAHQPIG